MIGYCPLGSGSKGNCIFVGSNKTKILVDAGLSAKATEERLALIGVSLDEIDAILISHEHADHIQGLKVLGLKRGIPILANTETAKGIVSAIGACPRFKIFSTGEPFTFGDIVIHPFSVQHDTLDPVMFTFLIDGIKLGICTDLGFATTLVHHHLQNCHYLLIESNHEPDMVYSSARPPFLKQRILGRNGHLSNSDCGKLLTRIAHADLKHVHLAHLSSECNTPEKALQVVFQELSLQGMSLQIDIAPQAMIGTQLKF